MAHNKLINPYELLGVSIDSDMKEIRKSYYELSLICHPDKGGSKEDFDTVHSAYLYVYNQMKGRIENPTKSYLELENSFAEFCKKQKEKLPTFHQIFVDNSDEIIKFNKAFENEKYKSIIHEDQVLDSSSDTYVDVFKDGYGSVMETDKRQNTNEIDDSKTNTTFCTKLQEYKEPVSFNNTTYGTYHRFDTNKISDFTQNTKELKMTDYSIAYTNYDESNDISIHNTTHDEMIDIRNKLDRSLSRGRR